MAKDNTQRGYYSIPSGIKHDYTRDEGLLVVPIAGDPGVDQSGNPNPQFKVIRVHAPVGFREVHFDIPKKLNPPVVPDPQYAGVGVPGQGNDVLLTADVLVNQPMLSADETDQSWRVTGTYVYCQQQPRTPADGFPTGTWPYNVGTENPNFIAGNVAFGTMAPATQVPAYGDQSGIAYFFSHQYAYYGTAFLGAFFDGTMIGG